MRKNIREVLAAAALLTGILPAAGAEVSAITSSRDGKGVWNPQKMRLENRASQPPVLVIDPESLPEEWPEFRDWGMTLNELDHDAMAARPE
ncbi:MAG: hypothetical protein K2L62_05315, partial [Muribaculaceae bacterium]|nr:hypothetical protein [Muribaculaceae bacterium]